MKITWLSANKLGYELLKVAIRLPDVNIGSIITLSENSETIMYDGVCRERWDDFGVEVFDVEDINKEMALLDNVSDGLVISCGWRQVIGKSILIIPYYGFIGFHPTLLPRGRGPAPIINSILEGYSKSGLTMFYLGEGVDDGDIIGQQSFTINKSDHADDVYAKTITAGKKLVRSYLPLVVQGKALRIPQNHSEATYFKKPKLEDNEVDFNNESAGEIFRKIRALSKPYKGAYVYKNGEKIVLWRAELIQE
jgi:methionyl-tRNA formyltransferase